MFVCGDSASRPHDRAPYRVRRAVDPGFPPAFAGVIRATCRSRPFQALDDRAAHHPVLIALTEERQLFRELADALAKYPNVSVKLSASPGISREPYPFRDVTVHLKRVFDAYGPQRSYWGTDLTNSYAKASYRQRVTHFTEELSFLSESDKDWVMGRAIMQRLNWT